MSAEALLTPEAASCALAAMRDGVVGRLSWGISARGTPGVSSSTELFVRPGRLVLSTNNTFADISARRTHAHSQLRVGDFFANCLTESEPANLWRCFEQAMGAVCPPR
jgi:hypothetical protein